MCLLTFYSAGVLPNTDALFNGAIVNNDGYGYAIVTGDDIQVRHGLDAEQMIAEFDADRCKHPDGPALFHSRFATHGSTDATNCHPFPIGGDPRTVLAHNGILPTIVQPSKKDSRSDTRILAEDFLPVFGTMRNRRNRIRLQKWMTPANKIVILTVDRSFTKQAYIFNEDAGLWDGGIWYSNTDCHLDDQARDRVRYGWEYDEQYNTAECVYCWAPCDPLDTNCPTCGGCFECGEELEDCRCYAPARAHTSNRP